MRFSRPSSLAAVLMLLGCRMITAQALTWDQVKARFEANSPALKADADFVDEARAQEISAYVRPNPQFGVSVDGTQIAPTNGVWQPLTGTFVSPSINYLHERNHKRELRLESAQQGTRITESQHEDLKRTLEFTLRGAFIRTLEAKAVLDLSKSGLEYYDHIVDISRIRLKDGDIAQMDFDRIELFRVQYESELQASLVNLRTAKIQLLQILNDRTPVDQFDVTGNFDFSQSLQAPDEIRQTALAARPDLQAALEAAQQAETNHKLAIANGSVDPVFGAWYTWNSSNNNLNAHQTLGVGASIPLRIFDRNQGEKRRTQIDIDRAQKSADAVRAQVFSDVDTSYALVNSNLELLKLYKFKYNDEALRIRETVTYAYQHGGASLLEFLSAQTDYRQVQLAYVQLIAAYLTSAAQLNFAVGQEVIQ